MADKSFTLDIVTPIKNVFSGDVEGVVMPGTEGYFQILHNHTPFMATIQIGEIKVNIDGKDHFYSTSGGFAEINSNKVSILAETAEKADDIDLARAEEAKKRAEERISSGARDMDAERARLSLFRALNRIRVNKYIGDN